jgi:uncharacterized membrane protein YbaN (DUF454 family)
MSKLFFAGCGWVFVLVGVIGIFIPLLPTTPFLLLAAFCFHKSSERFHGWLLNHKVLGPPVKNWTEHRIISKKAKVTATTLIATSGIYLFYKDTISNDWDGISEASIQDLDDKILLELLQDVTTELKRRINNR